VLEVGGEVEKSIVLCTGVVPLVSPVLFVLKNMGICSSQGNGTYVFVWQPTIAGTYVFRARYEGNTSYVESTSENITIQIFISLKTDLNRDGTVNILDIFVVANAFGATPNNANWNATADINKDDIVNILDIFAVAWDFGKTV
jgi:hypothetical protein